MRCSTFRCGISTLAFATAWFTSACGKLFSLLESLQLHLLLQACLQLVDGFELADGFSEFVIDFRQLFALYIIDMNFKFSFLALQSIYEVVCRECNLDIYIVACLVAFELVFKTWNEALGTDFQRIGLAFAAFEWFAVNKALKSMTA